MEIKLNEGVSQVKDNSIEVLLRAEYFPAAWRAYNEELEKDTKIVALQKELKKRKNDLWLKITNLTISNLT